MTSITLIRRWIPWVAFVLVFVLGTTLLSWWQFARREERVQLISQVMQNYDQPAVSLDELMPNQSWQSELEWRLVEVEGRYLPEQLHLVRNRPLAGRPGFLVLVPFELNDGRLIAVERGWLATGSKQDAPDLVPDIQTPNKIIQIRLRSGEESLNREPVSGQLASIDLAELAERIEAPTLEQRYYGRVVSEAPSEDQAPTTMPAPSLSEGNHLSYALQWILFGVMALSALVWAIRNERRQQLVAEGKLERTNRRKSRSEIDAEIEDALIDGR